MAGKSIINVLINGDTRGLTGALNDAGGKITSFATTAAKRFAVFSTALAGVATVVGKKAIDAASDESVCFAGSVVARPVTDRSLERCIDVRHVRQGRRAHRPVFGELLD
jgi:hypothetical protein